MQSILIVDDNNENLIALESLLKRPDLALLKASSGHEALRLLLKHDVALALIDVQMPGMNGFEMAELMRRTKKTHAIPIIFVAENRNKADYIRGYELGAADLLVRPVQRDAILAKAKVFLDIDRQKRELARRLREINRLTQQNEQLLQALGDGVISVDATGTIGFVNPAMSHLFGMDASSLGGRHIGEFLFQDKDGHHIPWASFDLHKATRRGERLLASNGYYVKTPNGLRPAEISAAPVSAADKDYAGAVISLRASAHVERVVSLNDLEKKSRKQTRRRIGAVLRVFERKTGMNIGRLINISMEGFKLATKESLAIGRRYEIGMILPEPLEGSNTLSFDARVVWNRPAEDVPGENRAGLHIINIGENDARILAKLIDKY